MAAQRRPGMRGKLGRLVVGMSIVGIVHAVPLAAVVSAATACNTAGQWDVQISGVSSPHFLTHARGLVLPAGAGFTSSYSLTEQGSLTASVSATVTGSTEAGIILAKASLSVGVTLKASGTKTTTQNWTRTWTFPGSSKKTEWVIYETTKKYTGKYQSRWCQQNYQYTAWKYGTWQSWNAYYDMAYNCATTADKQYEVIAKPYCP